MALNFHHLAAECLDIPVDELFGYLKDESQQQNLRGSMRKVRDWIDDAISEEAGTDKPAQAISSNEAGE